MYLRFFVYRHTGCEECRTAKNDLKESFREYPIFFTLCDLSLVIGFTAIEIFSFASPTVLTFNFFFKAACTLMDLANTHEPASTILLHSLDIISLYYCATSASLSHPLLTFFAIGLGISLLGTGISGANDMLAQMESPSRMTEQLFGYY